MRPRLRVLQHDRPEKLKGLPGIEWELRLREVGYRLFRLTTTAIQLGVSWAAVEALIAVVKWLK